MLNEMDEYLLTRLFTVLPAVEVTYLYAPVVDKKRVPAIQ